MYIVDILCFYYLFYDQLFLNNTDSPKYWFNVLYKFMIDILWSILTLYDWKCMNLNFFGMFELA